MMKIQQCVGVGLGLAMATAGCSSEVEEVVSEAPEPGAAAVEPSQAQTWNGFTLSAQTPAYTPYWNQITGTYYFWTGSVVITGGTGTQKQGVCLLKKKPATTGGWIACSSAAQCPAPPSGGSAYCTAPNNSGQTYCYERSGTQSAQCAGTPATGSAVGNGTYTTPAMMDWPGGSFVSYACVNGCSGTTPTPSVSAAAP